MSLKDKKVVIIGGSSGMGLATAKAAVAEGALLVIASRSAEKLRAAVDEIEGEVKSYVLDVTDEEQVKRFFAEVEELDHLVTTAAGELTGPFLQLETAAVQALFASKFWGQYLAAKYGASRITVGGSITMFSGVASQKPIPGFSSFAAVNGGINALCRALAVELAPLRVNAVSPGIVETPAYEGMPVKERRAFFDAVAAKLPVKRIGRPEDVARTVLYLMQNGYTTGAVIDVDGGSRLV